MCWAWHNFVVHALGGKSTLRMYNVEALVYPVVIAILLSAE